MYLVTCIVPIQVDAKVSCALPIMGDCVALFEDSHEVLHKFLALISYSEIVNSYGERDGTRSVSLKSGGESALIVSLYVYPFL